MSEVFQALRRQIAGDGLAAYRIGFPVDIGPHRIDLLAGAATAIARYRMQGLSVSGHWVTTDVSPFYQRGDQAHSPSWNAFYHRPFCQRSRARPPHLSILKQRRSLMKEERAYEAQIGEEIKDSTGFGPARITDEGDALDQIA
jgi:hypothetical protein